MMTSNSYSEQDSPLGLGCKILCFVFSKFPPHLPFGFLIPRGFVFIIMLLLLLLHLMLSLSLWFSLFGVHDASSRSKI